jgi:hypothetical protein
LQELGADDPLLSFAGLQICGVCKEDYRPALKAWGLEFKADITEHGLHRHTVKTCLAKVTRPTKLDAYAELRAEHLGDKWSRLFGTSDPETGTLAFDKAIWIEEHVVGVALELLADKAVQAAVVEALASATAVELNHQELLLTRQTTGASGFEPELLFAIDRAAVALAVCIERWAKARARS